MIRSPSRWITSVGTWIAGSTGRTSISRIIRTIRRNPLGLIAIRSNRATSCRAWADPERLGRYQSIVSPCPQRCSAMPVSAWYISSVVGPARIVRGGEPARGRRAEDQRGDPVGVGGGEQDAHRGAFGVAEQHRPGRAGGLHDRTHVVHPLFERGVTGHPVGQPGVPLVEQDQPAQRGQPAEEASRLRVFPEQFQVAHQARHEHDVPLALAEDLIGQVHAVGAAAYRIGGAPGRRPVPPGRPARDPGAGSGRAARAGRGRARCPARGQQGAQVTVGAQRVRLAAGPVQRQHELPEPLAERVGSGQRLELGDGPPWRPQASAPRPATPARPAGPRPGGPPRPGKGRRVEPGRRGPRHRASASSRPGGRAGVTAGPARRRPARPGRRSGRRPVRRAPPAADTPAAG